MIFRRWQGHSAALTLAIIIDSVTMLEQRWPSSRIASCILLLGLMFPGQTGPSDCWRVAINFDV